MASYERDPTTPPNDNNALLAAAQNIRHDLSVYVRSGIGLTTIGIAALGVLFMQALSTSSKVGELSGKLDSLEKSVGTLAQDSKEEFRIIKSSLVDIAQTVGANPPQKQGNIIGAPTGQDFAGWYGVSGTTRDVRRWADSTAGEDDSGRKVWVYTDNKEAAKEIFERMQAK